MRSKRQILVTNALPYANAALHLGHILEYTQTDVWVRFQKMRGHECYYVSADDAHGTAIMLKADEKGISAEEHIAHMRAIHEADFKDFLIGVDNLPYKRSESEEEIESQRHLAYVGATRAKDHLYVMYSKSGELIVNLSGCDPGTMQSWIYPTDYPLNEETR